MKVTINYNYIDKHKFRARKYFFVSDNERKLPKDYIVYGVLTRKKIEYYLITYDEKLTLIPKFLIKMVDSSVEEDWVYKNFDEPLIYEDKKIYLSISKYLGPKSFLEDETLFLDIANGEVSISEFNFFYVYNIAEQTKGRYIIGVNRKKICLFHQSENDIVVKNVSKFKINRYKKELYVISEKNEYFVINYEKENLEKYKSLEGMNVEYKFIFENNSDFINIENKIE